jgi:hypothetical protein
MQFLCSVSGCDSAPSFTATSLATAAVCGAGGDGGDDAWASTFSTSVSPLRTTCSTKKRCQRVSLVSSGWNDVPRILPCRTATTTSSPWPTESLDVDLCWTEQSEVTPGPQRNTPGARMNTALYGSTFSPSSVLCKLLVHCWMEC